VRLVSEFGDELAEISACNLRRIQIDRLYPSGVYEVIVANGVYASAPEYLEID